MLRRSAVFAVNFLHNTLFLSQEGHDLISQLKKSGEYQRLVS